MHIQKTLDYAKSVLRFYCLWKLGNKLAVRVVREAWASSSYTMVETFFLHYSMVHIPDENR